MSGGRLRVRVFAKKPDEHGGTYHLQSPVLDIQRKLLTVEAAKMIAERWRRRWKVEDVALCEVDAAGLAAEVIVQTKGWAM